MSRLRLLSLVTAMALGVGAWALRSQEALEPFRGITTDGQLVPDLFPLRATEVSTQPVVDATDRFLESLSEEQRAATTFPVDSDEWRLWNNIHRYERAGVSVAALSETQRETAFGLLRASLSAAGLDKARDIMRLNGVLATLTGRSEEYGEGLYHFTVMGDPSTIEPWGWQLDGHHLNINYFVLGDQVVMTPTFMGSEPVRTEEGRYAGTRVFGPEEARGLALMRALRPEQRARATVADQLPRNVFTAAFRDNFELALEGIPASELTDGQRALLLELTGEYVGNLRDGHARVKMSEVRDHLDQTYFAWIGGTGVEDVFYYRIHSPVILIEFDHQRGVALRTDGVTRNHIHTVVRTPNGNDYGKDLLRQHHLRYDHSDPDSH